MTFPAGGIRHAKSSHRGRLCRLRHWWGHRVIGQDPHILISSPIERLAKRRLKLQLPGRSINIDGSTISIGSIGTQVSPGPSVSVLSQSKAWKIGGKVLLTNLFYYLTRGVKFQAPKSHQSRREVFPSNQ